MPDGVYAAVVKYGGREYSAIANLGIRPTVSIEGKRALEVHLLGFTGDLYGEELVVELREFIRPERCFPTTDALRDQIECDKQRIEDILKTNSNG
jgi:riboflavin kinase/FMN adenylyltransferase